jgi:hypothetical protein
MQVVLLIEFSDIFDEVEQPIDFYLEGISKKSLIQISAMLLAFKSTDSQFSIVENFLHYFFCQKNYPLALYVLSKVNKIKSRKKNAVPIIPNTLSSLFFAEICLSLDENTFDIDKKSNDEIEKDIFKVLLILNSQFIIKQNQALEKVYYRPEDKLSIAKMAINQALAYDEFINFDLIKVFSCQVIKSIYLFELLQSLKDTQVLLKSFLEYFDCKNWQEYLNRLIPLTIPIVTSKDETPTIISVPADLNYNSNCAFFDKFSLIPVGFSASDDFINIRSLPIIKKEEGRYLVICGLFLVEKIFKSTYFQLNKLNNSFEKVNQVKEFHSVYSSKFSEEYLFYKILDNSILSVKIKISGKEIKTRFKINNEPDYYARKGNRIFLFESKDIILNAAIKTSFDYERIEVALKSKLIEDKKQPKAILQLVNQIRNVLSLKNPFDLDYSPDLVSIYPVLVLHDRIFNTVGLNKIVNTWFQEHLNVLNQEGLNILNVKQLIIIDIDTLIYYQDLFHNRRLELGFIIEEYIRYINKLGNVKIVSDDHLTKLYGESFDPFSVFISNYVTRKFKKYYPDLLFFQANKLFQ